MSEFLRGNLPFGILKCLLVLSAFVLISCGNGDEDNGAPPEVVSSPIAETVTPFEPQQSLPCYVELNVTGDTAPAASPTPETIRIQMLERPYRIVPNDIVIRQNRPYQLVIQAGAEWHHFSSELLKEDIHLPPGGEARVLLQTDRLGVFSVGDHRHIPESPTSATITVIPEKIAPASWHPLCTNFAISSPSPGATLSTPLIIEGSVAPVAVPHTRLTLQVARIEAWHNGIKVAETTNEDFRYRGSYSEFYLPIPELPAGTQSLSLRAILQNETLAGTANLRLNLLADETDGSLLSGYRGNIDTPAENSLLALPVTIQGWAVVPGQQGSGVEAVEIWNGPRETGQFLTEAVYGTYRPDVASDLDDPRFASSGFVAEISQLPAGPVDLHVYVRDRQSGDYVSPRFRQTRLVRSVNLAEGKVTDASWPVALAPAPDGRLFFAELLNGTIRILQEGQVHSEPFATLEGVARHGESGLLGLALHPNFPEEPFVYALYVVENPENGLPSSQRTVRFRDVNNVGQDYTVLIDNLPATTTTNHNGGRIAFGPDRKLFVSIGDTDVPELAQDASNLAGSILRYNPDGSIPNDNPFPGSPVFATGLRNVFGLAFQPQTGLFFVTDNGTGGYDEVNKIEAGQNYGWPLHMGVTQAEGFTDPLAVYGNWPEKPIGPTGVDFAAEQPDLLLFCAYHDFLLRAVRLSGPESDSVESTKVLSKNCALDVAYSADGWLYYSSISAIYRARLEDLLRLHEQTAQ